MTLKIFKIKFNTGSLKSPIKAAYAVFAFRKDDVSSFRAKSRTHASLDQKIEATGARVYVVARLKNETVKEDMKSMSLLFNSSNQAIRNLPDEWTDDTIDTFCKDFLSLDFWESESKLQAESMLSLMVDSTCESLGNVEFIEQTGERDKRLVINLISLLPPIADSRNKTMDSLYNFDNDELKALLEKCVNRHQFLSIKTE